MKHQRILFISLALIIVILSSLACSLPFKIVPNTPEPEILIVEVTSAPDEVAESEEEEAPPESEATATPEPPTPTVEHLVRPGEPGGPSSWVIDTSTKSLAASRETGADLFTTNYLERPFTSEVMDYQAHLDLIRVNLSVVSPWIYGTLILEGSPPADSEAIYALEIDLDSDGRGDWLIMGAVPPGSEWTTDGAKAYQDTNGDVGGFSPMNAEDPNPAWDGYETLVFENYLGSDPDLVWIRRDPGNANQVQIAFKHSLIGNDNQFAYGGWADEGLRDPAAFDYNDSMTFDQAGSTFSGSSKYPIKELASVDNTCRWTYGYDPTTAFPGLCPLPATPTPTPEPGAITGGVFFDRNGNGFKNGTDPGISDITVRLGQGACGSSGYASTSTGSSGSYTFSDLPAGTYCVSVVINKSCGGWLPTTAEQRTVNLSPGELLLVTWFGYSPHVC